MSPFGRKDDDKQERLIQWRQAVQAEFDRLNALAPSDLAIEVFTKGFGPGGPGADDADVTVGQANINAGPTASAISDAFVPSRGFTFPVPTSDDQQLIGRIERLVAEGLQELEHASLVRAQMHTAMGSLDFATTRRGRAALERGDVRNLLAGPSG